MEPVITVEGFNVLKNPDESRSLLSHYFETMGFHVVKINEVPGAGQNNGTSIIDSSRPAPRRS